MSKTKRVTGVVVTAVFFQVSWYLLVQSAGEPYSAWLAVAVAVVMLGLVSIFTETPGRSVAFLGVALVLGGGMDTALTALGCIAPERIYLPYPVPPAWLLGLWIGFAGFARISLRYLCGRPAVQFAAGLFGGPAAYFGGVKLGAVTVHPNILLGYGLLAVSWGVACIVLFTVSCMWHEQPVAEEQ